MKLGLRAGPHRLAIRYTDIRDKSYKIVLMDPKAFEYLIKRQDEIDLRKAMGLTDEEIAEAEAIERQGEDDAKTKERTKLEQALKNARSVYCLICSLGNFRSKAIVCERADGTN